MARIGSSSVESTGRFRNHYGHTAPALCTMLLMAAGSAIAQIGGGDTIQGTRHRSFSSSGSGGHHHSR